MVIRQAISRTPMSLAASSSSPMVATLWVAKRDRIILDASGTIPGSEETMSGMGIGMGIAGLPTGSTFSFLAKSLWMMLSPKNVKKTAVSMPAAAAVVARMSGG